MRRLPLLVVPATLLAGLACGGQGLLFPEPPGPGDFPAPDPDAIAAEEAVPLPIGDLEVLRPWFVGSLEPETGPYVGWKAADLNPKTTWVVGDQSLHLAFAPARPVTLELIPGFALDARRWAKNRRPTRIRVRYSKHRKGLVPEIGPWHELDVEPPETLGDDPWVRLELPAPSVPIEGLELEVLDATPKAPGGDDDVCISEVRVVGSLIQPVSETGNIIHAGHDAARRDRLEAPFGTLDLDACDFEPPGTGGMYTLEFHGDCSRDAEGLHFRGENRSICYGQEEYPVFCDPTEREDYNRDYPVVEIAPCRFLIDDHPYTRQGCQGR